MRGDSPNPNPNIQASDGDAIRAFLFALQNAVSGTESPLIPQYQHSNEVLAPPVLAGEARNHSGTHDCSTFGQNKLDLPRVDSLETRRKPQDPPLIPDAFNQSSSFPGTVTAIPHPSPDPSQAPPQNWVSNTSELPTSKRRKLDSDNVQDTSTSICRSHVRSYHLVSSNLLLTNPSLPEGPGNRKLQTCVKCRERVKEYRKIRPQRLADKIARYGRNAICNHKAHRVDPQALLLDPSLPEGPDNPRKTNCISCREKLKEYKKKYEKKQYMKIHQKLVDERSRMEHAPPLPPFTKRIPIYPCLPIHICRSRYGKILQSTRKKRQTRKKNNVALELNNECQDWTDTEEILLGIAWERFRPHEKGAETFWSLVAACFRHRKPLAVQKYFLERCRPRGIQFKVPASAYSAMRRVAGAILCGYSWKRIKHIVMVERSHMIRKIISNWTSTECILLGALWERYRCEQAKKGVSTYSKSEFAHNCMPQRTCSGVQIKLSNIRGNMAGFKLPKNTYERMIPIVEMLAQEGSFVRWQDPMEWPENFWELVPRSEYVFKTGPDDEELMDEAEISPPPAYHEVVKTNDPPPMQLETWHTKINTYTAGSEEEQAKSSISGHEVGKVVPAKRKRQSEEADYELEERDSESDSDWSDIEDGDMGDNGLANDDVANADKDQAIEAVQERMTSKANEKALEDDEEAWEDLD